MLCMASTSSGSLRLAVKSAMQPLNARIGSNTPGTSEIQRITIGGSVTNERQVGRIHILKKKINKVFFSYSVSYIQLIHQWLV